MEKISDSEYRINNSLHAYFKDNYTVVYAKDDKTCDIFVERLAGEDWVIYMPKDLLWKNKYGSTYPIFQDEKYLIVGSLLDIFLSYISKEVEIVLTDI